MPLFLDRYLSFSTVGFYFLLALAVDRLAGNVYLRYALIAVVAGGLIYTWDLNPTRHREVQAMVSYVRHQKEDARSLVYFCPDYLDLSFVYYYDRSWYGSAAIPDGREYLKELLRKDHIFPISSKKGVDPAVFKDYERIIYIDAAADFAYPHNGILSTLKQSLDLRMKKHFEAVFNVYVFE